MDGVGDVLTDERGGESLSPTELTRASTTLIRAVFSLLYLAHPYVWRQLLMPAKGGRCFL